MKPIEDLAREAGMESELWNMGAASCVYTEGCEGVGRDALERFAALVREDAYQDAANLCVALERIAPKGVDGYDCAGAIRSLASEAIRALAVPKECDNQTSPQGGLKS